MSHLSNWPYLKLDIHFHFQVDISNLVDVDDDDDDVSDAGNFMFGQL